MVVSAAGSEGYVVFFTFAVCIESAAAEQQ